MATNCVGTGNYIANNWEYQTQQDYYKTSFNPVEQGVEKLEIPCINHIDRELFQNIFGTPNLSFIHSSTLLKIDKNNQNTVKPNQKTRDRYYTSPHFVDNFDFTLLEVDFYPATQNHPVFNEIRVINCQNITDTIISRLSYIDSLGHYNYTKKGEKDLLRDAQLYSSCFSEMDSSMVRTLFGKPSVIINKTEWEYRLRGGEQKGYSFKMSFNSNGTLSAINYLWVVPYISKSICH